MKRANCWKSFCFYSHFFPFHCALLIIVTKWIEIRDAWSFELSILSAITIMHINCGRSIARCILLQQQHQSAHNRTLIRHGSKRTLATPYYDPQDFTLRDRSPKIPRSLYHHPEDYTDTPEFPPVEPLPKTPEWVAYKRAIEAKELEGKTLKQKLDYFTFAPPNPLTHINQQVWDKRRILWQPFEIAGPFVWLIDWFARDFAFNCLNGVDRLIAWFGMYNFPFLCKFDTFTEFSKKVRSKTWFFENLSF